MKQHIRGIIARHPLLAWACVAAAGIAVWSPGFWLAGVILLAWLALSWWLGCWKQALIGFCGIGIVLAAHAVREERRNAAATLLIEGGEQRARGVILREARGGEFRWQAMARLTSGAARGTRVWWQGSGPKPLSGAMVEASGLFLSLPRVRNEGAFDEGAWLRNHGIVAVFDSGTHRTTLSTGRLARLSAAIRHGFREAVTDGLPPASPQAQVIRAVVVGEMPRDADSLVDVFRRSGSLHVFSVSGLHVVLMAGIGWFFLKWCHVPRRAAIPLLLVLVVGYAWITGNSPPALRAAWMTAVFLGAFVFRRRPDLLNTLGAVLLGALLVEGRLIFQPGVQLSYGVVAAIGVGAEWARRIFQWIGSQDALMPEELMTRTQRMWLWLRRWIAGTLGVSTAAAVGSAPLTAWHFGMVTPISIPASLLLVPLVGMMLACALVSSALHPICPPLSRLINHANARVAGATARTAAFFAGIPGGHYRTRRERGDVLRIYDLPYGAGAACFSHDGTGVLVDCGGPDSFRYEVLTSMRTLGVEADSAVLTHPDGQHLGGAAQVWESMPLKQVILPVDEARSPAFRAWKTAAPASLRKLSARHAPVLPLSAGARLELIHAPDPRNLHIIADKRVAIYLLHWHGARILLHADAGYDAEQQMLQSGANLQADIIITGRSQEGLSLTDDFLDAVDPRLIIAANPEHPLEQRLPETVTAHWRARGIAVMDQRITGGVTIRPAGPRLECRGYFDSTVLFLTPAASAPKRH